MTQWSSTAIPLRGRGAAWRRRTSWLAAIVAACAAVSLAAPIECRAEVGEWPQFLGPDRNGMSAETGLLEEWPDGGPKELWRAAGGVGMSGLAIRDGRLVTMPITHLTCIHADTGARAWQQARFGKGNLIAAEGKLFISTMKGEIVVLRATPKKYDEIGRCVVLKPMRQAPALAGGLLYVRDDAEIVCLDVRRE